MEYEDKLKRFENNCYEMAGKEAMALQKQIETKINEGINDEIEEYRREKEEKYQKRILKLEKNFNSEMFAIENEYKTSILKKEEELTKKLQQNVLNKLKEFKKTEQYYAFLLKNINETINEVKVLESDQIKVYLTREDIENYASKLNLEYEIIEMDEKNIGGSKCVNITQNIEIDNTLKTRTQEEIRGRNGGYIFGE